MASSSKTDSEFTRGGGSGPSQGLVKKGNILSAYPQDNVSGMDIKDTRGGSFGGGDTNISHSISGSSAVQKMK